MRWRTSVRCSEPLWKNLLTARREEEGGEKRREGRMGRGSHEESSYDLLLFNICMQFPCVGSDWLHSSHFTSHSLHITDSHTMYNREGYLYTHWHMFTSTCTTCIQWHNTKLHDTINSSQQSLGTIISLVLRLSWGKREPGIHCLRMCLISKKSIAW